MAKSCTVRQVTAITMLTDGVCTQYTPDIVTIETAEYKTGKHCKKKGDDKINEDNDSN